MPFNLNHVDLLLQYALLLAGEEEDYTDRQLGPIHLIKYAYLGDLEYAKHNAGETFTGIRWRFYKFGPWSNEVYERIEPALYSVGAQKRTFPSDYGSQEDWVRWSLRDEQLLERIGSELPIGIRLFLRRDIRKYCNDTPSLLEHVYNTVPMLSASPNEDLDFELVAADAVDTSARTPQLRIEALSERKKKNFKERLKSIRHQARQSPKAQLINPVKKPRYDSIYEEGVAWLDSLAGPSVPEGENVVEFSDSVWKSVTRKKGDVS